MTAIFSKIQDSLKKTRFGVFGKLNRMITARRTVDDEFLEELEELLISGDVGVQTSMYLIDRINERARKDRYESDAELLEMIKREIASILKSAEIKVAVHALQIILVIGVNGTGKTTSIAKLAKLYRDQDKRVILAAADTFRAAAIEQLTIWAERVGCDIIKHQQNADPSAVVFDAISAALARKADCLIIDTAGRLHTKTNLMAELEKIYRVIQKKLPEAPHEVILVLDASTGQNAINQAREFSALGRVDNIFLTKLDGTAKGGVVLAINNELNIPVKYVGTGEKLDDIALFDPAQFVEGLFLKE